MIRHTIRAAIVIAVVALRVAHADPAPAPAPPPDPATEPTTAPPTDSPDPAKAPAAPQQKKVVVEFADGLLQRVGTTWDITLSGGIRLLHGGDRDDSRWWFGRARLGILRYQEPTFLILGIAGQLGVLDSKALGIEAELIDLWRGVWGQAGVWPIDSAGGVSIEGSLGYTLFGVEYQRRLSGDRKGDQALMLSLHIPLGVVLAVRKEPKGVVHPGDVVPVFAPEPKPAAPAKPTEPVKPAEPAPTPAPDAPH